MLQKKSTKTSFFFLTVSLLLLSTILLNSRSLSNYLQAAGQSLPAPPPNYLLFTNPTYGISIQYPEDWQEIEGGRLSRFNTSTITPIAEFHPADMSVGVIVFVEELVENMTLDQYIEEQISFHKTSHPNSELIEQSKITLAGMPGYKAVFNGTFDVAGGFENLGLDELIGGIMDFQSVDATIMVFTTIHGNNAYNIGYSDSSTVGLDQLCNSFGGDFLPFCSSSPTITDPFSQYLPIVQTMVDSFDITAQNQTIDNNNDTNLTMPNNAASIQPTNDTQQTNENPCSVIDMRLATGEIPIEEYERLREILQC